MPPLLDMSSPSGLLLKVILTNQSYIMDKWTNVPSEGLKSRNSLSKCRKWYFFFHFFIIGSLFFLRLICSMTPFFDAQSHCCLRHSCNIHYLDRLTKFQVSVLIMKHCALQSSFWMLALQETKSFKTVQKFWRKYRRDPPNKPSIFSWYKSSVSNGCVCKGQNTNRHSES